GTGTGSGSGAGATTTGGGAATTPGGGGTAGVLAKMSDVPVGGGIIVEGDGGPVLLVQPTAGQIKAYNPACTHQGTQVEPPQGGVMTCPNHGSQFAAADGSVKKGPANGPLAAVEVTVSGEEITLA
ncbi:MAG TPA: Rieske (2Fe-2S) protein, partial [Pseudonocardiaceae bacterium]